MGGGVKGAGHFSTILRAKSEKGRKLCNKPDMLHKVINLKFVYELRQCRNIYSYNTFIFICVYGITCNILKNLLHLSKASINPIL